MPIVAFPASAIVSGTLAASRGGLGADASAFAGFVAMNSGVATARTLTGTTNQISITNTTGGGNPVFSTPQNIDTGASFRVARLATGSATATITGFYNNAQTSGGATQLGQNNSPRFGSDATNLGIALYSQPILASGSYTQSETVGNYLDNPPALSGGAVITNLRGSDVRDQTRGTNNFGITVRQSTGWGLHCIGAANHLSSSAWIFGQMTAPTPGTNQGAIYSKDVAGTAEMCAKDEANNEIQLTPHPGDLMGTHAATMASLGLPAVPVTWFYDSFQRHLGKRVSADMGAVVRCVEYLMSKDRGSPISLLQVASFTPVETWQQRVDREQAEFTARRAEFVRQVVAAANVVPGLQPSPLPKWDGPAKFVRKSMPSYLGA